jgi:hypothetical protein
MPCTKRPFDPAVMDRIADRLAVAKGETAVYLYGLGPADVVAECQREDPTQYLTSMR